MFDVAGVAGTHLSSTLGGQQCNKLIVQLSVSLAVVKLAPAEV